MIMRRDLGMAERFILFQIQRIRLLRESSVSHASSTRLTEAKAITSEMSQIMKSFWDRNDCSLGLLNAMAGRIANSQTQWMEFMDHFPNSVQFREVYINYLLEVENRFSDAVFQKSRVDLIETGASFHTDTCFRQFVRRHPDYLRRQILDIKGNAHHSGRTAGSDASAGTHGVLDAAVEDYSHAFFPHFQVRLTMEHAFQSRFPRVFSIAVLLAFVQIIVCSVSAFSSIFTFKPISTNMPLSRNALQPSLMDVQPSISPLQLGYIIGAM
jgi:hypothetical protein